ncbi:SDR family NAD(P)-dependent oxidoreductase [Pseudoroseicyclus sp. CXY001]|uniref:SDR family NAD(P)-dependent oxidoreductase n=1 Tax=Pseudoroseicyclus sp. CXY001 TaxID=3242492 RepID=UPI00358DBBDF
MSAHLALVTGAATGIGLAICEALAQAGHAVLMTGLQDSAEGEALAADIAGRTGADVTYRQADLLDEGQIEALVGPRVPDIVVNNAVLRHFGPVEEMNGTDWNAALGVNLSAPFHLARLCVPQMKRAGWGRIVNIASIYATKGAAERIDYVTTKAGLIGMTRALSLELARTGVTCNAVSPGTVLSEPIAERIAAAARRDGMTEDEAAAAYLETRNPSGRFIALEAVGAAVAFLCSDAAADINGANLPIDGGWSNS